MPNGPIPGGRTQWTGLKLKRVRPPHKCVDLIGFRCALPRPCSSYHASTRYTPEADDFLCQVPAMNFALVEQIKYGAD